MASSDDEDDVGPQSASNYHFVDDEDTPISFSVLPVQWTVSDVHEKRKQRIFLHGSVDKGLRTIHKEVKAWKFDLLGALPDISVLTKDNNWIKLEKPRKSFEEIIRKILITVHCLHFARRNPGVPEKSLWDHLSKTFSTFEVRPSFKDLVAHVALISEAVKRDNSLAKSKFLLTFLDERLRKRKLTDEDAHAANSSNFIDDSEIIDDVEEGESSEEDELFDSVCAICDNGGTLLCCEGSCMRSFHLNKEDGLDSSCSSLGFTREEVEAIQRFYCKNCEYKQHQCFACGELGSSDKFSRAEVFRCANATCGHFYHPHCIAKLLHPKDEVAVEKLEKSIASGEYFTCPAHKCCVCKQGENKKIKELQFAVCRRCPTSYHRKCLPKEIVFDNKAAEGQGNEECDDEEEDIEPRAWEDLLPNRVLIYCLKHEIIEDFGTPIRDIRFPDVEEKKNKQVLGKTASSSGKVLPKKRKLMSEDSHSELTSVKESKDSTSSVRKVVSTGKGETISSRSNSLSKLKAKAAPRKSLGENMKSISTDIDGFEETNVNRNSLGDKLYELVTRGPELGKLGNRDTHTNEIHKNSEVSTKYLTDELPPLDPDSKRRVSGLIKEVASRITMDEVMKKHVIPSTHAYSLKSAVEKTINAGKVEGTVQAVRTALKRLEDGCGIEDAKAVCEPEVLNQVFKWKNKLRVYLAPFLHGMRYTSFGRHFTKVEKLQEIVNLLHWYVQDDDMVVDFCCGANDFSLEMKKKLEETGKKCSFKNYDVLQPKNDFNFEKRDWMTVQPAELPKSGSQLIMGLNPPFGFNAALANKFIDKALEFKPKLLILIVPPETERLEEKDPPYDLVWEDDHFLSGKSFYLPGSVDENDKQIEQWNNISPPLYLWSRQDWTDTHMAIAQKHGHLFRQAGPSHLEKSCCETKIPDPPANVHARDNMADDLEMLDREPQVPNQGCSPNDNSSKESRDVNGPERNQSMETSGKRKHGEDKLGRGIGEKLHEDKRKLGKSPENDVRKEISHHSPRHDTLSRGMNEKFQSRGSNGKSPESDRPRGISHHSPQKVDDKCSRGADEKFHNRWGGGKSSGRKKQKRMPHHSPHSGEDKLDRGMSKKLHDNRRSGGKSPGRDLRSGRDAVSARSSLERQSSAEMSISEGSWPNMDPHAVSSSHLPYGTSYGGSWTGTHDDWGRQYGSNGNSGISHGYLDERSTGHFRGGAESASYRELERESNMRPDVGYYGRDVEFSNNQRNYVGGHDPGGYSQRGSLSSTYGQAVPGSDRMGMSVMQRYAPQLDETNHVRIGADPFMASRDGFYDARPQAPPLPPRPGYYSDTMGFAAGPHYPYASNSSAGWLNE